MCFAQDQANVPSNVMNSMCNLFYNFKCFVLSLMTLRDNKDLNVRASVQI